LYKTPLLNIRILQIHAPYTQLEEDGMRRISMRADLFALFLVLIFMVSACATPMTRTQKGAAVGTGVGAAVGAGLGQAIGRSTEATLLGAGAGAVAGALAGGMIGNYMDKQEAALRQSLTNVETASVQRQQDTIMLTFKSDFMFPVGSANLSPGAYSEIDRVARVLNEYPQTNLIVEGHTDATGSEVSNQTLSERRAEAVAGALASRGVAPQRLQTVGFGETRPIAPNNTESGKQMNRRVTVVITPMQA
jgi:outer membrane protein OmpA-like peptidoglycan-associated protein